MREELKERAKRDALLYEKFVKGLEVEHQGEFVAVSLDGRLIFGKDDIEVLKRALNEFGKGGFAFRKVGFRALGKWRRPFGR